MTAWLGFSIALEPQRSFRDRIRGLKKNFVRAGRNVPGIGTGLDAGNVTRHCLHVITRALLQQDRRSGRPTATAATPRLRARVAVPAKRHPLARPRRGTRLRGPQPRQPLKDRNFLAVGRENSSSSCRICCLSGSICFWRNSALSHRATASFEVRRRATVAGRPAALAGSGWPGPQHIRAHAPQCYDVAAIRRACR